MASSPQLAIERCRGFGNLDCELVALIVGEIAETLAIGQK